MRMIRMEEENKIREFVINAAKDFSKNKEHRTYTNSEIEQGCLFALRFGLDNDCIVIFKLDECFEPINYQQIIGIL